MVYSITNNIDELLAKLDNHGSIYQTTNGPQLVHDGLAQNAATFIKKQNAVIVDNIAAIDQANALIRSQQEEIAVLREALQAMRKLRNLHWRRAIDAEREVAVLREDKNLLETIDQTIERHGRDGLSIIREWLHLRRARAAGRREG